jgi:AcrR family transcriptional regulator
VAIRTRPRGEQQAALLEIAGRLLEEAGPEALQARRLAAEIGASTQAIYTLFGGMPGVFGALVADGFARFAAHVAAAPETVDPVADHFVKGAAFCEWALRHPQLYRLMFGLTGGRLRLQSGLELQMAAPFANFPEGQAAVGVLIRSLDRVKAAGRIRPVDTEVVAGQFLSATHGWVLLVITGAFELDEHGRDILAALAINLMVGLGDTRAAAERSLAAAGATMAPMLAANA